MSTAAPDEAVATATNVSSVSSSGFCRLPLRADGNGDRDRRWQGRRRAASVDVLGLRSRGHASLPKIRLETFESEAPTCRPAAAALRCEDARCRSESICAETARACGPAGVFSGCRRGLEGAPATDCTDDDARRALLDRAQGAGAAQRQTGRALRRDLRRLARLHHRNWPDLKSVTSTWPRSTSTRDAPLLDRDAELRALHDGGEIRRLDLEMLDVALLHLEQDRAGLLDDGGRHPVFAFLGNADRRIRRDQDGLLRRASGGRGRSGRCGCCRRASGSRRQSARCGRLPPWLPRPHRTTC